MSLGDDRSARLPGWLRGILFVVIIAGVLLRIILPGTTVFLNDQARACGLAADIAAGRWETAGLTNSAGLRNFPGFGYLLAAVWRIAPSPWALLAFTNIANLAALGLAAWLLRRWVAPAAAWWGLAFFSAAPWAIQYCRWIWAQDLLFPCAVAVYLFLWRWVCLRRPWAALAVILALTITIQIHLAGVILLIAALIAALWGRAPLRPAPIAVGLLLSIASFAPYFATQPLRAPAEQKRDYRQTWRVVPAAAMSVSGLLWMLEFKDGYPAFARSLSWRRWPYELLMTLPPLLAIMGLGLAYSRRNTTRAATPSADPATSPGLHATRTSCAAPPKPWSPLRLAATLTVLIPLLFIAAGLRVSPTYLPIWYPLPFIWIGLAAARLRHPALRGVLLIVLCAQLSFFAEQLHYQHRHGGVPGSVLDRSMGGLLADFSADAVTEANAAAGEIWAVYEGPSEFMHEPTAFLLRWKLARSDPGGNPGGDPARPAVLLHYRPWTPTPILLTPWEAAAAPPRAARIRPREGPWQVAGTIPIP